MLPEIPHRQALEGLAVTGFVTRHFETESAEHHVFLAIAVIAREIAEIRNLPIQELLPEIPVQQALERLAVTRFVAGHLVDGVVVGLRPTEGEIAVVVL